MMAFNNTVDMSDITVSPAQAKFLARQRRCLLLSITGARRISLGTETHLHDCLSGQTDNFELQIVSPYLSQIIKEFYDKPARMKALREVPKWIFNTEGTYAKVKAGRLAERQSRPCTYYYKHDMNKEQTNLEENFQKAYPTREIPKRSQTCSQIFSQLPDPSMVSS